MALLPHILRQWICRQGVGGLGGRPRGEVGFHSAGEPRGECRDGEFQRPISGRVSQCACLCVSARRETEDWSVADRWQWAATATLLDTAPWEISPREFAEQAAKPGLQAVPTFQVTMA